MNSISKTLGLIPALALYAQISAAQQAFSVSGKVIDKDTKLALQGVTIKEIGGSKAAATNAQGEFTIVVKPDAMLSFSYVSYTAQTVSVSSQKNLIVEMISSSEKIEEVVVTALGIKKEKKTLTYAAQSLDVGSFAKVPEPNIANSLSGRVAGLDITRSSSGVSGSSRVVLRGERSMTGNSQALVVVDGIPINNNYYSFATTSPGNATGGRDVSDGISSVNPNDIESVNVLKGASAAALYGSRASNGALLISTKKGNARKGIGISFGSSTQLEAAMQLHDFQQEYGQGSNGEYIPSSEYSWGPKLDSKLFVDSWSLRPEDASKKVPYSTNPDNYKSFYKTGITTINSLAINGGTEHTNAYFSYTNTYAGGIVDKNKMIRHNLNLRLGGDLGTSRFSYDSKLTYLYQRVNNAIKTGETFDNVNRQIVRVPTNIDLADIKNYQFTDENGRLRQNYWNPTSNGGQNPYWIMNNTPTVDERNRIMGFVALNYKILPNLNVMFRSGMDRSLDSYDLRWYNDTYVIAPNGNYQIGNNDALELNNDLLLTYNTQFGEHWTLNANGGANIQYNKFVIGNTNNTQLIYPNFFNTGNALQSITTRNTYAFEKQSVFAAADVGFKKFLFLNLTGRIDRSSTLPKNENVYPFGSIGLTAVLSDMVKLPDIISFAKIRGSWARTGNDAGPYQLMAPYSTVQGGSSILVLPSTTLFNDQLRPERTTGYEAGFDVDFWANRLGLSFTYYNTNTKDQLFNVTLPTASGSTSQYINSGDVRNNGFEIMLEGTPIRGENFSWKTSFNYAQNDNKVLSIFGGLNEYVGASDFMNTIKAVVGRPFGELYSRGFVRDTQGRILVDEDSGMPLVTSQQSVYLGNTRPDWIGGWSNTLKYKNWAMSFLISARIGGVVSSLTNAVIDSDGLSTRTLVGREGFIFDGVYANGDKNSKSITAEQYFQAIGGRNTPIGEQFTYSASNIRLRELLISYSLPESILEKCLIKGVTFSLTGRNLFFLMNKAKNFDPESVVGSAATSVGLESFGLPPTRLYGLDIRVQF